MSQRTFGTAQELVASAIGCDGSTLSATSAIAIHPAWDSISHLSIMMLLEQEFGIEINDASITRYTTLASIESLFSGLAK